MTGDLFEQDAAARPSPEPAGNGSAVAGQAQTEPAAPADRTSIEYFAALQHRARYGEWPEWGPK